MEWTKSPPALIEAFDAALPEDPRVERRQMFGYPCAFVNGQMFTGLHQEHLIVRLDDRGRGELLAVPGAEPFQPMPGRFMREYVVMPPRIIASAVQLREWLERAFGFALTLPAKGRSPLRKPATAPAPARKAAPRKTAVRKTTRPRTAPKKTKR
jgi:TfoX/Sxy family transcriptional regulator of competence genes